MGLICLFYINPGFVNNNTIDILAQIILWWGPEWGTVLGIAACIAEGQASARQMPVAFPPCGNLKCL